MKSRIERRYASAAGAVGVVSRDAAGSTGNTIKGLAVVFYRADDQGTEYTLFRTPDGKPSLVERILPGACDEVLRRKQDVLALWDHNPGIILGRVSNGTLKLTATSRGLQYEVDCDTDADAFCRPVLAAIRRRDCVGSSFSFLPAQQRYITGERGGPDIREISQFSLIADVSPVSAPAYTSTTAFASDDDDDDDFRHGRSVFREWQEARAGAGLATRRERFQTRAERVRLRKLEFAARREQLDILEANMRAERYQRSAPTEPELARMAKQGLARHYPD